MTASRPRDSRPQELCAGPLEWHGHPSLLPGASRETRGCPGCEDGVWPLEHGWRVCRAPWRLWRMLSWVPGVEQRKPAPGCPWLPSAGTPSSGTCLLLLLTPAHCSRMTVAFCVSLTLRPPCGWGWAPGSVSHPPLFLSSSPALCLPLARLAQPCPPPVSLRLCQCLCVLG